MPEFLKLLCISTELPELEIPRRRSVPFTSSTPLQEVVAKLYTMPMLNALKEKTRELDEWINQAETQSDMYDQQAEKKEPKSISDYINLSYSERAPHREKMGKVKEWEEIHAEIECMKDHAAFLEARQKYFHSVEKSLEEVKKKEKMEKK
jgi:electron transfer flavoprotein alpha subunit